MEFIFELLIGAIVWVILGAGVAVALHIWFFFLFNFRRTPWGVTNSVALAALIVSVLLMATLACVYSGIGFSVLLLLPVFLGALVFIATFWVIGFILNLLFL